jgi:WD40 repeat protein
MATANASDQLTLVKSHRVNEKVQATIAVYSEDGTRVAISYRDFSMNGFNNKVLVWDLDRWKKVALIRGCSDQVDGLAFSHDGKRLVCVGGSPKRFMGGVIVVWNTKTWKVERTIEADDFYSLHRVALSSTGKHMATGSALSGGADDKIELWSFPKCRKLRSFAKSKGDIDWLSFSPDGKNLAVGMPTDRAASVWTIPAGKKR